MVDGLLVEHLRDAIDHHLTPVLVLGLVDVIIQVAEAVEHAIASEQQDLVAHGGAGTMGRGVSEVAAPPPCSQPCCRRCVIVRDEDVHRVNAVVLGVV